MRYPRVIVPSHLPTARYHCVSRVLERRFYFGDKEKDQFVKFLREYEKSCGVRVLTYCILSNHFHVLVDVPRRPSTLPDDSVLFEMLAALSGTAGKAAQQFKQTLLAHRSKGEHEAAELLKSKWCVRMWDLGTFMKLLKQRFSIWFNRVHHRKGTLWEERYRSHAVDGAKRPTAMVAAYIDLNPVRAGIVRQPEQYKYSGYAEAVAGGAKARENLHPIASAILRKAEGELVDEEVLEAYRSVLGDTEKVTSSNGESGSCPEQAEERRQLLERIQKRERVAVRDFLKLRVRYFEGGIAFGNKDFVEAIFHHARGCFGPKRKSGARKVRGLAGDPVYTLRDLRRDVFT